MNKLLTATLILFSVKTYSQCTAQLSSSVNGLAVTFTDNSTTATGTSLIYMWNFGDGNVSTQQNPVHMYSVPGCYSIKHVIQNNLGCADSVTVAICVTAPPPATVWKKTYGGPGTDIAYSICAKCLGSRSPEVGSLAQHPCS